VTFNAMNPGETIVVGGLKYTADVTNTATEVATAFANIKMPDSPVVNAATITFTDLKAGQAVTVNGLSFIAASDLTSSQVAGAFTNIAALATTGTGTSLGAYTGILTAATGASAGNVLTLPVAPAAGAVMPGVAGAVMPENPTIAVTTQGTTTATEVTSVTFKALKAGQSVTVAGLTLRAKQDLSAAAVGTAFSGVAVNATPADSPSLAFTGKMTGYATPAGTVAAVVFTSTAVNAVVPDLTATMDSTIASPILSASKGKFSGILSGFSTGPIAGSTINFTSSSEMGTTFKVSLPATKEVMCF
jgi:hypothetical protein